MLATLNRWIESNREKARRYKALEQALTDHAGSTALLEQRGHTPKKDPASCIKQYQAWAYNAANRNAVGIAKAPLRLYATRSTGELRAGTKYGSGIGRSISKAEHDRLAKTKGVGDRARFKAAVEIEEIETHPFMDLIASVSPFHDQFDLMEATSLYLDLTGNTFWRIVKDGLGMPKELWVMPSQLVRVVPDKNKFVKGYLFGKQHANAKPLPLSIDQVVWFFRVNPADPWCGMGRIEGAYYAVHGYSSMQQYEAKQMENNGIKDMLIKYKGGSLDRKKRRELMAEWDNALRRASDTRAPMIADEQFDIESASWSPKEMTFLKGREWSKEEIVSAFGQSPSMWSKDANRANIDGAIYLWEEFELLPTLTRIAQKINEQLLPMYEEPRLFVAYDDVVDSDREQERADSTLLLANGMPLNRILEEMGKDPLPGGDVGYVSSSTVPLGSAPLAPFDEAPKSYDADIKSKHRGSIAFTGGTTFYIKENGDVDLELTGGHNTALTKSEQTINRGVKTVWQAQTTLAIREAGKLQNADFSWVASEEWAQEIVDLTSGAIAENVIIGGRRGARQVGIQMADFIDRPGVQTALREHSFKFAQTIGDDSASKLRQIMIDGMAKGESIPELQKRIQGTFTSWSDSRGEMVARTESARAQTTGVEAQWAETGVVAAKVWDANGDACPFCLDMNGKVVELGRPFLELGSEQSVDFKGREIRLSHNYETVTGPPLHPRCRCSIRPEYIET